MTSYIKNWFSNMRVMSVPIEHGPFRFKTPEHFYQAMKADDFKDACKIANEPNPRIAKRIGRKIKIRQDWENIKIEVMKFVQVHRFSLPEWRKQLLEHKGDIVEWNNWHDNFWGDCVCDKCKHIKGENNLGKILMDIRKQIEVENGKEK